MPNPFYVALGDHDGSLQEAARRGLEPFRHYLQNSITALKGKEASCSWRALDSAQWRVSVDEQAFRIMPFSELELFPPPPGWYEITQDLADDVPVMSMRSRKISRRVLRFLVWYSASEKVI